MIQNTPPYSPSFPLSLYPPTSHWKRPIFSSFFLKCILIVQESFALVLQVCIYHALIRLIPH
jgi:hypothetical protein